MRTDPVPRPFLAAALLALLAASPVDAQDPAFVLGVAGGVSLDDDLTPGLAINTALEPGFLGGPYAEWHPGRGPVGLRISAWLARRGLKEGMGTYVVATGDLGLVLRAGARPSLGGMSPFAAVTGGATLYDAGDDSPVFAGGAFGEDPVTRVHVSPSVGFDRALSPGVGLRLEGGDRIVFPGVGESPPTVGTPVVHIPFFMVGLHLRLGTGRAQPSVAARPVEEAPVPDEAPADTAEPAPPPAPPRAEPAAPPVEPAPPPAEPAPPPADEERVLYTVQVGDFVEPTTADRWAERLTRRGIPHWRIDREIQGTPVARLRVGATTTEEAALDLAGLLEREFGWPVSVRPVEPGEPVPADALPRTRAVLDAM